MRIKNAILALAIGIVINACSKDNALGVLNLSNDYADGILISNEGPFNNGTGTVTFISDDLTMIENAIFKKENAEDLGNIVQSIGFTEERAYIIANVSNKINVVNRNSFEKEAEITTGLNNPRYFVSANGKGYVTNWGDTADDTDDFVAIVDLTTNTIEGSIAVELGPEEILVKNDKIYVAHQGAFGQNNKISVIDSSTNEVATVITVGDVPNSMQLDATGNLWVLCGGKPSFTGDETAGAIYKIDTLTDTVSGSLNFAATEHPNHLISSGSDFYYSLNGGVYRLSDMATTLPVTSEFTGLNVYAMVANDNKLYVTDAKDFASNGSLTIYDLGTTVELSTLEVGIIPGGIYFN